MSAIEAFLHGNAIHGRPILVALSGGPDSLALLRALQIVASRCDVSIGAAHLNHLLRGKESHDDEDFVRAYCLKSAVELHVERVDVRRKAAESGENLEAVARRLRYAWLARIAHENHAAWVATGHTADDQAETVLHHLMRGAGLRGLRGIANRRPLTQHVEVIRPLLKVKRETLVAFLSDEQVTPRHDSTNHDLNLMRNRIRWQLLPLLKAEFNPEIVPILCRLAIQANDGQRRLTSMAQRVLLEAEKPKAGTVIVLDAGRLAQESPDIVREVFHLIWDREDWPADDMTFEHWQRLADLAFVEENAAHDFPNRLHIRRTRTVIQIRHNSVRSAKKSL